MQAKTLIIACLLGSGLIIGSAVAWQEFQFSTKDKRAYLDQGKMSYIRPGLNLSIDRVEVGDDRSVTVTFRVMDDLGVGLDLNGVETPGVVSTNFLLGALPREGGHYTSYINRTQTSPITDQSATQPTSETGGELAQIEQGVYSYRYDTLLPETADMDATHTVGMYVRRDLREFDMGRLVDNATYNFVPSGAEVTVVRDIVSTATCNSCHDPLAIHGGARTDIDLCVMCHYDGVDDPDTGNSVGMGNMVHKIHMGANLPSVQAGTPYQIIGFRQSVHDYSGVIFPQDIRNCASCHDGSAVNHEAWMDNPSRDACGACHDDVNFATGENHVNLPQVSDNQCASCHFREGELEFDASILGAHKIESESTQLAGINIQISGVENAQPGLSPTIYYALTSNDGAAIDPAGLPFLNFNLTGNTIDYGRRISERAVEGSVPMEGGYAYTFSATLPDDASGTWTAGGEAFRMSPLNAGTVNETMVRETGNNPVYHFPVTDAEAVPRRHVVSTDNCQSCHYDLKFHGDIRHGTDYCVTCHFPGADDSPFRPEGEDARAIDFKFMIHRIHRGEELNNEYTMTGFNGHVVNYNHVVYPGDLRNCESCHISGTYNLPSGAVGETVDPYEHFSPIPPQSASCLSCHDSVDAAAHAWVNISPFGESCVSCHGPDAEFSVEKVHAR